MRFLGNSEAKTDAKGRVFLPAVFRKQLQAASQECLILRKDTYQDCLVLYPENVWNEQMNELRCKLNRWNSRHQMIFRQFVSDVEVITLDGNVRFLIPKRYLKLAKIQQDVRFIGLDDTIEIWSKEIADEPFITPEDFGKELEEIISKLENENLPLKTAQELFERASELSKFAQEELSKTTGKLYLIKKELDSITEEEI